MGYNFVVSGVGVALSEFSGSVDIDVNVTQTGVAPFYYPLSLVVGCSDLKMPISSEGVHQIISQGESKLFAFVDIPASSSCLGNVSLSLSSPYAYEGRPIKFAQGENRKILLNIPMPPQSLESHQTSHPMQIHCTPIAVAISMALLVIAFLVVKQRRQHNAESKALEIRRKVIHDQTCQDTTHLSESSSHFDELDGSSRISLDKATQQLGETCKGSPQSTGKSSPSCDELAILFRSNSEEETPKPDGSLTSHKSAPKF